MQFKILVIEDDRIMRENTSELLELSGYEVASAENGKKGVELVKTFKPDLIVCDIMMPELDGFGVLYILSKNPKTANIPFIFLSAKTEKIDLRKGMNLGADDYITKPFDDMELLSAVESRLRKLENFKKEYSNQLVDIESLLSDASDLKIIESLTETRKLYPYDAKEFIYREGDMPQFLYFINRGKVKTYRLNDDMKEYILEVHSAGDFLGYKSLIEDRDYDEYAVPLEKTEIYKIPKLEFLNLIYSNQEVANKMIQMLSKRVTEKEQQLVQLAYDSVKKRIILQIKKLSKDFNQKEIDFSRGDFAKLIGTSKETLVRVLTSLKEDGLITSNGHNVEIIDFHGLNKMLEYS
ncbi:MAG: response regulator [Bacteroidetes bacterium]|nr:MAG: response regulator [Bacteroidota bacterium]MBL1145703.1 response regulator [Bacteroidota bacterium]MCB0802976.1 response regulator [Flavobacteriales bacterium]NOG58497.1 response regulator [Bacteroidota bacterium]